MIFQRPPDFTKASATGKRQAEAPSRPFMDILGEKSFQVLAENLPLLIWTAEPSGRIDYSSRTPWTWEQITHPRDLPMAFEEWQRALELGQVFEIEVRLKLSPEGGYRWFLSRAIPVRDEFGQITKWLGTSTDIHELKLAREKLELVQAELIKSKESAEAANHAKSAFLANMSHEIRTPLAAIIGFSEFLIDKNQTSSDQLESITTIRRNAEHLSNLVNEILDLSKIEAGHLEVEPITFGLGEILEYVEAVLGFKAGEKAVALNISVDRSVPRSVTTDPTRLRQILLNVIGNAVKFTDHGKIDVHVSVIPATSEVGDQFLKFLVSDTGVGISRSLQHRLFQPFVQTDCSTTRKFGGTGLGLSLSRRLARALGGDVRLIESSVANGAKFEVMINIGHADLAPAFETKSSIMVRTEEIIATQKQSFKNIKILVVDDANDNRSLMQRMLKPSGAIISTAVDGVDGVEKALAGNFDLVLMDIQMPGLDGLEATKQLRAAGYRKPIIALTAHALKEDREMSFQAGFDDHLTKPIDKSSLISVIAHYAAAINKTSGTQNLNES